MLKRALVATVATLSVLPAAFAAAPTFTGIFDQIIQILGSQGLDFLMAFGLVAAVIFMAISRIPAFTETAGGRVGAAMFAVLAGLATAFYVFTQKIPFLQLIGPYFMLIMAIVLGLLAIQIFTAFKEGATFTGKAATVGLGGMIIGALILFFAPALATLGAFVLIIGIIAFFVAGAGLIGSIMGPARARINREVTDIDYELRDIRTQNTIEAEEVQFENRIVLELTELARELEAGNLQAANALVAALYVDVNKERKLTQTELKVSMKLMNDARKAQKLARAEEHADLIRDVETRADKIENLMEKQDLYLEKLEEYEIVLDKYIRQNILNRFEQVIGKLPKGAILMKGVAQKRINVGEFVGAITAAISKLRQIELEKVKLEGNLRSLISSLEGLKSRLVRRSRRR